MAEKEMYDFLPPASPDYNATLSLPGQIVLPERGFKNQGVNNGDDGSEERISFSDQSVFEVDIQMPASTASIIGDVLDFYHDSAKGNGIIRSFKWEHPTDGHTYVVRFASSDILRTIRLPASHGVPNITFKVLGYV